MPLIHSITAYVPIRKCEDDGHTWLDVSALDVDRAGCNLQIRKYRKAGGAAWDDANRVVRIVKVLVVEVG